MTMMSHLGRGLAAVWLLAAAPSALAETFTLADGSVIEGSVVRSLGNTVSIKYQGAGMLQVPLASVQLVEIETADGGVISGRLTGWSKGVYELVTADGPIEAQVEGGKVVALVGPTGDGDRSQTETAAAAPSQQPAAPAPSQSVATSGPINAGFVYVGTSDDGGRTFMNEMGRRTLAENPRIGVTTNLEIETDDRDQVVGAVDQLVADGANLIIMTGNDSTGAVSYSASRHQNVRFVHCGSLNPTTNVKVFCGRIYQARYLSGIVAGGMTSSGLIGYVAAEPASDVLVGINAFALGVQSVNPDAEVVVHWTNARYGPGTAQERALDLIERGVDVMTIHQDSPAALQMADQRGVYTIGFQSDMSAFAPSSILTSAVWNWDAMYSQIIDRLDDGDTQLRPDWLGLREGVVGLAPISDHVPETLKQLVEQRQREIVDGRFSVFTGPIRDVDGDIRVRDGRTITDENLQAMDYLVDGVVGY